MARVESPDAELDGEDAAAHAVCCPFPNFTEPPVVLVVHCGDRKGAARMDAAAARSELCCLGGGLEKFSRSSTILKYDKMGGPKFFQICLGRALAHPVTLGR